MVEKTVLPYQYVSFVPFGQDDWAGKPASLVADFAQVPDTVEAASGGSSSNRCCCDDRRIGADGAERGGKPSRREAEADFLRVGVKPPRDAPNRSAKIS